MNTWATPPVDILEGATDFLLTLDLPGVAKDGVNVELNDGKLVIDAKRGANEDAIAYRRVFDLNGGIDEAQMTAQLEHGVLSVRIPKTPEKKPLQIPVNG